MNKLQLRELSQYTFLLKLAGIDNLTTMKLLHQGLKRDDIKTLVKLGYLTENQDTTTGLCYYQVELPSLGE